MCNCGIHLRTLRIGNSFVHQPLLTNLCAPLSCYYRVMYNIEGNGGAKALVYAEKTSLQGEGDFVYVVVEQPKTKTIIPIIDNREVIPVDQRQKTLIDEMISKNIVMYGGDEYVI